MENAVFVLDTGTGNDLCPKDQVGERTRRNDSLTIETANGIVRPDTKVTVALDALDEEADCIELDNTVRALSIGRRCAAHG